MIRYLIFYIASAFILCACLYWIYNCDACSDSPEAANSARKLELVRQAELVDYFCLSKRPPAIGQVTIPRAWEKVLNASINIFDNVGEACGSCSELSDRTAELAALTSGEGVYAQSEEDEILVYRPKQSPEWFLVISKPLSALKAAENASPCSKGQTASIVILSLVGALVLTLLARFTVGGLPAKN